MKKEQENKEYREILIKENINESMKAFQKPVDFLMYMLNDAALKEEHVDVPYTDFENDEDLKLDYILDQMTAYMKHKRLDSNTNSLFSRSKIRELLQSGK